MVLAACGGKPDTEALRTIVNERLALALPAGTVELAGLERRGSQADTKAPSGETRRIVYYDVELKLKRDFDFGAWNAPGVAGLVSALGAGPKGIVGITTGGNKAGDIIRGHGSALYQLHADQWTAVTASGYTPPEAPANVAAMPLGLAAIPAAIKKVLESVPAGMTPAERAVVQQELASASTNIQGRLARMESGYAIAAGEEHGQYLRLARAIAANATVRVVPLITHGGEENLALLRNGKASFAIAQGDAALDAYEGVGAFSTEEPYTALRAIGSLYPEAVHILVRADSPLMTVANLRGKRIAVGEPGSASRTTALRVLEAHGLHIADIRPEALGIGAALVALKEEEVDAVILVIGTPADSVRDALADTPLRLLQLSPAAIATLTAASRGYFPYTIAPGAYANQVTPVATIGVAALMLTNGDLSDSEVAAVTHLVFGKGQDFAALGSIQGAEVSAANARQSLLVPQHLAAAKELDAMVAASQRSNRSNVIDSSGKH